MHGSTKSGRVANRTTSDPESDYTRRTRRVSSHRISADDMWMPSVSTMNTNDFKFVYCSVAGCTNSSAFSEYNAMTLRSEFDTCTLHTNTDLVAAKIPFASVTESTTYIFYDIEVTSTNEIEQIAAVTTTGEHFDIILKTATRRNSSPIIGKLTPMVYMMMSTEPKVALEHFVVWVNMIMNRQTGSVGSESDVVLVAHNGMCHDHVMLLKTMMVWGMNPPKWRLADSLPMFKIVVRPGETSTLSVLANVYAPWFAHVEHDALSDATALRNVVIAAVEDWMTACYVFSSSSEYFITSVGLNTFKVRNSLPFPTAHMSTNL